MTTGPPEQQQHPSIAGAASGADLAPPKAAERSGKRAVKVQIPSPAPLRNSFRFRGRSFLAFALAPEPPIADWLRELDGWLRRSEGFFAEKPVVLDLTGAKLSKYDFAGLIAELETRGIRLMGVEGVDRSWVGPGLPPLLQGGRTAGGLDLADPPARRNAAAAKPSRPEATSLLLDSPVRSGQSVVFPHGDVTVIGSVASGAEVIAGGSIHVYGALRGRAMAGATGNARARIFCGRIEAELLAIDGLYKTADDIEAELRGRAIQAWLDGDTIRVAAVD
jgi:septum site-determining protein MinC